MKFKNFSKNEFSDENIKITPELAYLLGALRDGSIDLREGKNYEIKIFQNSEDWLLILKQIIDKNFNTKSNVNNGLVRITRKEIVSKIIEISNMTIPQVNWNTPEIIKESLSKKIITSYIRGFWDAEGGLPKNPIKTKKAEERYISFHQKNKEALDFIREKLIDFGYHPTKITFCGKVFEFRICRKKEIMKFYKEIGTWHSEKKERLKKLIDVLSF